MKKVNRIIPAAKLKFQAIKHKKNINENTDNEKNLPDLKGKNSRKYILQNPLCFG